MKGLNSIMKIRQIPKKLTALALAGIIASGIIILPSAGATQQTQEIDTMWANFSTPLDEYKSRPLWFWNDSLQNITKEQIREIMVNSKEQSGYFGFGILPNWIDNYMSDKYLELYEYALQTAKELGMKMCLYDENGFPSGSAGGLLPEQYPEDTLKRLDKSEGTFSGGQTADIMIPQGEYSAYMGAVAMNMSTNEIVDISDYAVNNTRVQYTLPDGDDEWKVMAFATVKSDTDNLRGGERVDYLDKTAVDHLIEITHQAYYDEFPEYFGTVIDSAFYDEPMLYKAEGRTWTGKYNELFEEKYGYNPITLYPALWYDIGENTESARNTLMGFRTDLFAENYIKNMNDWCNAHGIKLTGHMDQEENVNPVSSNGDLMKVFKYQDIPGVDEILSYDRARKAYKIVSSSAYNWDKDLVMTETYGAMGENVGMTTLYKDIMNQFAKGINYVVPHAIWHNNTKNVENPPELSYRSAKYGKELSAYNDFISRTSSLLQSSRHVADIGVYYPIDTLMGAFRFDAGDPYTGGVTPSEADYMEVGDLLSATIRYDYTYLHPEVISENCTVDGDTFKLNNTVNYENYKVLILPGSKTISWEALKKIKEFYDNGGKVIATTQLPYMSSENGHNEDVINTICEMFNITAEQLVPKSIECSASSVFQDNPTYGADKAFDGVNSDSSRWNAGDLSGGDQWLSAKFDSKAKINKVVINEFGNGASIPYRVTKFRIQYHDGSGWVDCYSGTEIGESMTCTFDTVETDRIRLYIDTIKSDSASIQELEIYDENGVNIACPQLDTVENENSNGGSAVFLGTDYKNTLKSALDMALDTYDVEIELDKVLSGGDLTYIHKVKNDTDIYYFANSSNSAVTPTISLRGEFSKPMAWDPHTGERTELEFTVLNGVTTIKTQIPSAHSVFIIDGEPYEAVTGIAISNDSLDLTVGETASLAAAPTSKYATNQEIIWSSSDSGVASIDAGNIKAVSEGTAVIRAESAENSEIYAECIVTVKTAASFPADTTEPPASRPSNSDTTPTVTNGTQVVNGKTVLYVNGAAVTGTKVVTVSGKMYAVVVGYVKTGKKQVVKIGGKYYIVNASGVVQKGTKNKLIKVGTKSYVVNKNGVVQRKASGKKLVKVGAKSYIVNKLGVVQKGSKNKLVKIGKKAYIVNKSGVVQKNKKSIKVGKKTYKTNKKGVATQKK